MQTIVYGNTLYTWSVAAIIAAVIFTATIIVRHFATARLATLAARTDNEIDDLLLAVVRATRTWFLIGIALVVGVRLLTLDGPIARLVTGATIVGLVLQGALWGNVVITNVVQRQVQRRMENDASSATTMSALGFLARLLMWSVLLLVGLENLGVDVTALVAGLGVGGIAVALAAQNILGDLFASLSIVMDKPFVNGDFIIVGDMLGNVEHIGLKTTRVRSLHGEQLVFSNADLLNSRIRNFKRMEERRIVFALGVTYDTPPAKVAAIPGLVREAIEAQELARFDRAHFKSYGAFSLDFEIVYYMLTPDYALYMDTQQAINLAILNRFAAEGIEFAFPTQTLHVNAMRQGEPAYSGH